MLLLSKCAPYFHSSFDLEVMNQILSSFGRFAMGSSKWHKTISTVWSVFSRVSYLKCKCQKWTKWNPSFEHKIRARWASLVAIMYHIMSNTLHRLHQLQVWQNNNDHWKTESAEKDENGINAQFNWQLAPSTQHIGRVHLIWIAEKVCCIQFVEFIRI